MHPASGPRLTLRRAFRATRTDETDAPGLRHGIDDLGLGEQPGLQSARGLALWRDHDEGAVFGVGRDLGRRALGEHFSLIEDDGVIATFGLVQIRGADKNAEAVLAHEPQYDLPQFAAGKRIDADRRLVEQKQLRRAD